MKEKQLEKGSYGYFNQKRRWEILKTILMFAVSFSLFFAGYNVTGKKANILTIVAVLGMLPASKSAVSMIMYLRYHGCSSQLHEKLTKEFGDFDGILHSYDLVFTTYKINYQVPSVVVKNGNVCGICQKKETELNELNKHITQILSQNGLKANVKMFYQTDTYINRIRQLKELGESEKNRDEEIRNVLHQISL